MSWAGGLPLELLLEAEAVAEIDLCFSSLDIFGLAPRFRRAAESGAGAGAATGPPLALIQSLRAREQNLPFLPLQIPEGSAMMERCPALSRQTDARTGRKVALVEAREIDVFCLHAPRADTAGNVEIYGAQALDKIQAGRGPAGSRDGGGDRAGRRADGRPPQPDPPAQPGQRHRACTGRRLSVFLPARLCD